MSEIQVNEISDELPTWDLTEISEDIKDPKINTEISEIRDTLYSSYDIYLSEKYEIKVFQNTIERLKNNFR